MAAAALQGLHTVVAHTSAAVSCTRRTARRRSAMRRYISTLSYTKVVASIACTVAEASTTVKQNRRAIVPPPLATWHCRQILVHFHQQRLMMLHVPHGTSFKSNYANERDTLDETPQSQLPYLHLHGASRTGAKLEPRRLLMTAAGVQCCGMGLVVTRPRCRHRGRGWLYSRRQRDRLLRERHTM